MIDRKPLGACYLGDGVCYFRVWAPLRDKVEVHLISPKDRYISLEKTADGYHEARLEGIACGSLYWYRLDGDTERADPASRFQPAGVHGPSQAIDPGFAWHDGSWQGLPLRDYIIYELHVGTFTTQGTFEAIIPHLDHLTDLGVTAVELMPVAQFPGHRNWGYDGVFPYAVQNSYGGPQGLKRLIDACHGRGLAVILDVVYNHLGPEGNYLWDYGPYFVDRYQTPWGAAINFDGPYSDEVRDFFVGNAVYWVSEFHVDALRVDAVHGIFDFSARHILEELADAVHEAGARLQRRVYVTAESDLNDARLIRPKGQGGYGLDAQWNDDFHHALHTLLTEERDGYYADFGEFSHLVKALKEGFVYSGQRSRYRLRRHGNSSANIPHHAFVVFSQNHDQIGNRAYDERLSRLVSFERLKLAAGLVLLNPCIPLLFMGEEYGETAPFPYFVSHSDPDLVDAVRKGRREEFAAFAWKGDPPDPQDEETFRSAHLNLELRLEGNHAVLHAFYRELIRVRKQLWRSPESSETIIEIPSCEPSPVVCIRVKRGVSEAVAVFNVGAEPWTGPVPLTPGTWATRLDSAAARWNGQRSAAEGSLESGGEVTLHLPGLAFVVLIKDSPRGW
jgi:maltooligosyltrehalose trehalohydrolase